MRPPGRARRAAATRGDDSRLSQDPPWTLSVIVSSTAERRCARRLCWTRATRQLIADLAELAPLHNPGRAGRRSTPRLAALPGVPQVAAFDTAFHATIPEPAAHYPVPWEWTQRWGLRRFGFHGLSVQYAVRRSRELLGAVPRRLVVCHLGAGLFSDRGAGRDDRSTRAWALRPWKG